MTIFQKLSWMVQMGIRDLCGEEAHPLEKTKRLSSAQKASLASLDNALKTSKSSLSATATHPIGGIGSTPATVMCVLEAPSAHEDKTGEALSGPEGELLKKMLAAIGLDINKQTYVGYLSPWRAPGARVLTTLETNEGLSLLNERIRAVNPQVLLLFGLPVTRAMLKIPLGEARNTKHDYHGITTFASFAPNFLLKNTEYKKQAWADLKRLQAFLEK